MPPFALDPLWNDIYTAGGFWIGVAGLLLGYVGYRIAITQLRQTKQAADAAREAAEKTVAENKEAFERFVAAFAGRLLSELQAAANRLDWKVAELRAHDLADLLATLPVAAPAAESGEATRTLREFAQEFARKATDPEPKKLTAAARKRWDSLLLTLRQQLDRLRAPFRGSSDDPNGPDPAAAPVPGAGPRPTGEDPERAGDVGPDARPGRGT